jgi:hypothetical protein
MRSVQNISKIHVQDTYQHRSIFTFRRARSQQLYMPIIPCMPLFAYACHQY